MFKFALRRLINSIPLILGITFLTFLFIHMAPGDFLSSLRLNPQVSSQTVKAYSEQFGLDKPLLQQYLVWLGNLLKGDLGYSFAYHAKVSSIIGPRALNTLLLSLTVVFISWSVAIPLGAAAAMRPNGVLDRVLAFFSYIFIAVPVFIWAFLFLYLSMLTGWLPLGGMRSIGYDGLSPGWRLFDIAKHLVIPAIVLSLPGIAALQKIMKASLLEALASPYVMGSRARGLSPRRIVFIHAFKNAANPMITIFGYQISGLLSGAALTEIITGWPGLGQMTLAAVQAQDIYLVMGTVLAGSLLLVAGNLAADILLAVNDPRIRYEK
jgi:peptide/nickel transport system permease protein